MIAASEVVFASFTTIVLCMVLVFGYIVYANSWKAASAIYEENANITTQLLKYYPEAEAYFPIPYQGKVLVRGGKSERG